MADRPIRQVIQRLDHGQPHPDVELPIAFPWRFSQFASFGMDRLVVTSDLGEVTLVEGQAERLEKLGDLISGLVAKVRGEGKAEGWWFVHGLFSLLFRCDRVVVLNWRVRRLFGHAQRGPVDAHGDTVVL